MSVMAICDGVLDEINERIRCDSGWQVVDYQPPFAITDVDPLVFAAYVGSGFFLLLPLYVAVIGGRVLVKSIF